MPPIGLLLLIMALLLIIDCVMGTALAFCWWWSTNLAIGMLTPPVWICLFVNCGIANVSSGKISRAVIPLVGVAFLDLLIACLWSPLTM